MLIKEKSERNTLEIVSLDGLVPQDHLLRKIDCAVDFTHIYDFVEDLYCADNGRPGVDPVVLFKMVLIQHLYGIPSLRRTVEEINRNIAYRWFLGYLLHELVPHFATISYNFRHRFSEDTIEKVFIWILFEAQKSGYLSPEAVFMDGTHIKATANIHKKMKKAIPSAAKAYEEQLMKEINEDRRAHGKKPFDGNCGGGEPMEREVTVSTTDPESGMFRKGFHEWYQYVYDEYLDIVICPEYKSLRYSTTNRRGYREYKSLKCQCAACVTRHLCTANRECQKTVTRHIREDYIEQAEDIRHSPQGKESYRLRSQTIERVFADAKEKYGMRYTPYRGLKRVRMWVRLKYAAMNLKKLAMWKWKVVHRPFFVTMSMSVFKKNLCCAAA